LASGCPLPRPLLSRPRGRTSCSFSRTTSAGGTRVATIRLAGFLRRTSTVWPRRGCAFGTRTRPLRPRLAGWGCHQRSCRAETPPQRIALPARGRNTVLGPGRTMHETGSTAIHARAETFREPVWLIEPFRFERPLYRCAMRHCLVASSSRFSKLRFNRRAASFVAISAASFPTRNRPRYRA
jgi:hypothetical protein